MKSRQAFFDSHAQTWEQTCYPESVRIRLLNLIETFEIKPDERVLDVGTGTGVLIPYLESLVGPSGRIWAFDLSFEMVKQARQKPFFPKTTMVIRADVHHIPFLDNSFDRVICFAAFPHFDHPDVALCEMARVLKPHGQLVIAHLMSRQELAIHHGQHPSVNEDILPDDDHMTSLLHRAMLHPQTIVDRPGRYLVKAQNYKS